MIKKDKDIIVNDNNYSWIRNVLTDLYCEKKLTPREKINLIQSLQINKE